MKRSSIFLFAAALSTLLLTNCGPHNDAVSTDGNTGSYGQEHPGVGTDGDAGPTNGTYHDDTRNNETPNTNGNTGNGSTNNGGNNNGNTNNTNRP